MYNSGKDGDTSPRVIVPNFNHKPVAGSSDRQRPDESISNRDSPLASESAPLLPSTTTLCQPPAKHNTSSDNSRDDVPPLKSLHLEAQRFPSPTFGHSSFSELLLPTSDHHIVPELSLHTFDHRNSPEFTLLTSDNQTLQEPPLSHSTFQASRKHLCQTQPHHLPPDSQEDEMAPINKATENAGKANSGLKLKLKLNPQPASGVTENTGQASSAEPQSASGVTQNIEQANAAGPQTAFQVTANTEQGNPAEPQPESSVTDSAKQANAAEPQPAPGATESTKQVKTGKPQPSGVTKNVKRAKPAKPKYAVMQAPDGIVFYHPRSKRILKTGDLVTDSNEDSNPASLLEDEQRRNVRKVVYHASPSTGRFIQYWDEFFAPGGRPLSNYHLPDALKRFAHTYRDSINQEGLLQDFSEQLLRLQMLGRITTVDVVEVLDIVKDSQAPAEAPDPMDVDTAEPEPTGAQDDPMDVDDSGPTPAAAQEDPVDVETAQAAPSSPLGGDRKRKRSDDPDKMQEVFSPSPKKRQRANSSRAVTPDDAPPADEARRPERLPVVADKKDDDSFRGEVAVAVDETPALEEAAGTDEPQVIEHPGTAGDGEPGQGQDGTTGDDTAVPEVQEAGETSEPPEAHQKADQTELDKAATQQDVPDPQGSGSSVSLGNARPSASVSAPQESGGMNAEQDEELSTWAFDLQMTLLVIGYWLTAELLWL
ncbi:MAG: hypothetical protein Q9162_006327 [Coniocarpon cinnabarinum]